MTNVGTPSNATNFSNPEREECPYLYDGSLWRKEYMGKDTYNHLVAVAIVNLIAVFPTILLNALVIFAVATRHRLRSNSNILLAYLAGTDLLSGLIVQPIAIAVEMKRIYGVGPFCTLEKITVVAHLSVGVASLNHIAILSIVRYIAIKHPLRYRNMVTKKRIKIAVLVAWAITVSVTSLELTLALTDSGTKIYSVILKLNDILRATIGSIYIVVIGYTCVYIYLETRRRVKRLQTEQLSQEEVKKRKKDSKAAITLAIILGALVLTNLPSIITFAVRALSVKIEPRVMSVLWSWLATSVMLGSLLNPVIYCWRIRELRRTFLEIMHLRRPENSPPVVIIEMKKMECHRSEIQPSTCEAFSMSMVKQEPVLLSFSHVKADEITRVEKTDQ